MAAAPTHRRLQAATGKATKASGYVEFEGVPRDFFRLSNEDQKYSWT